MFDSPVEYCPVCKEMVLLDQTRRECKAEHRCKDNVVCPLERCFSGYDFSGPNKYRSPNERPA